MRARVFGIDGIFLDRSTYTNLDLGNTIAHEVGHYFELDHTHQYFDKGKCRREAIDRNRTYPFFSFCFTSLYSNKICESTGDGLSDTPADPNLVSNFSCDYLLGGNDLWGDSYTNPPHGIPERPNAHNIMSYNGDRTCIDVFSRLQIAVMLHSIYRGKSINNRDAWKDSKAEYDDYEMDNFSETARPIVSDEIQQRNFNQQYNGDGIWGQCDVDWVRFIPQCSNTFDIQTSAIAGRINANTRLTIFDAALNQLAQNDDISISDLFSKTTLGLVAGQTYFIRVENMSANVTGYYNLNVAPAFAINGDNIFCGTTSNNYAISNLPVGATVVWTVTTSGIATPNTSNATQTTLNKTGNGIITLAAVISNACGSVVTIAKPNIIVGKPQPGPITFLLVDPAIGKLQAQVDPVPGATSYNWYKNGVLQTGHGTFIQMPITRNKCNVYYDIAIEAVNSCGTSLQTHAEAYVPPCNNAFSVSPNPASNSINVSPVAGNSQLSANSAIDEIRVYDVQGNLKKDQKFGKAASASMNIQGLINGSYYVEIISGSYSEKHQLVIQN